MVCSLSNLLVSWNFQLILPKCVMVLPSRVRIRVKISSRIVKTLCYKELSRCHKAISVAKTQIILQTPLLSSLTFMVEKSKYWISEIPLNRQISVWLRSRCQVYRWGVYAGTFICGVCNLERASLENCPHVTLWQGCVFVPLNKLKWSHVSRVPETISFWHRFWGTYP